MRVLHQHECKVCPLNRAPVRSPKMKPTGSDKPLIYILGEAPGADEDREGRQFVGKSGRLLRDALGDRMVRRARFNNVIRTRPPNNRTPHFEEIECCRPSIERDIVATKPAAILGFGNVPLHWACGESGIQGWRGRRLPLRVGDHCVWFYPMLHPAFVLRARNERGRRSLGAEWENQFRRDIRNAIAEIERGLPPPVVESAESLHDNIEVIPEPDLDAVERALEWAGSLRSVAVDYETISGHPFRAGGKVPRPYGEDARLLSMAVGTCDRVVAFGIEHPECGWTDRQRRRLYRVIRKFLLSPAAKVAHNARYEMEWSGALFGLDTVRGSTWHCTQVQAYTLDNRAACQSLDALCILHMGLPLKRYTTLDRMALDTCSLPDVLLYNARDVKYTYRLYRIQRRLLRERGQARFYTGVMLPRNASVVHAQIRGLDIDVEVVKEMQADLRRAERRVLDEIAATREVLEYRRRFGPFNPASHKDVERMLTRVLGRNEGLRHDGSYSTDADVLESIGGEFAGLLLRYRHIAKRLSTYVEPLTFEGVKSVLYPDRRVHTSFNTTFTDTGRLSSDSPNLQNFPKRNAEDREVRRVVVAPPGHLLVSADYGQIEWRGFAMASRDPKLVEYCWSDYDVHRAWAERLVRVNRGLLPEDSDAGWKHARHRAKNEWVFPLGYGAEAAAAARSLGLPRRAADRLYAEFWEEFPRWREWQRETREFYAEHGYVTTLTGRRRYGPLNDNMTINSPIQGLAADIVCNAMDRLSWEAEETGNDSLQAVINIHDDLTFVVPIETLARDVSTIIRRMVRVPWDWVCVPISIEVSCGPNWMDMREIGVFRSDRLPRDEQRVLVDIDTTEYANHEGYGGKGAGG